MTVKELIYIGFGGVAWPVRPVKEDKFLVDIAMKTADHLSAMGPSNTTKVTWTRNLMNTTRFFDYTKALNDAGTETRGAPAWHNVIIPPKSKVELYTLVASCGSYLFTIDKLFRRVHDMDMKCVDKPNSEGIENCNYCPYNSGELFDHKITLKDGPC